MIVKIYKNCKLNSKYKDVFFNKTYLETYLGTLDNITVINDSDLFSRNNDKLYFDDVNVPDFKQYNYIKIEDSIGTFYAFINNIEWANDVYTIYYEEDIMSNYFEYAHIRNSLLTGNKSLKLYKGQAQRNINYFNYPILPQSNESINVLSYNILDNNDKAKISLVVKLQLYKLNTAGEPNERICIIGVIGINNNNIKTYDLYENGIIPPIDSIIEDLINERGTTQLSYLGENYYYDIDKIYAVPYDFIISNNKPIGINVDIDWHEVTPTLKYFITEVKGTSSNGIELTYEKTINYDRKIDSIGLFTSKINIVNNGTDITVKIQALLKYYGISFILNVQNKMIDITDNFIVELPFTQASSSELQLQRLQLNLQENSINNKIDNANEEIRRNTALQELGIASGLLNLIQGKLSGATEMLSSVVNTQANITENENDINYARDRIRLINKSMYSSTSILNNKFSYINGLYGLCVFTINEDNTLQVEQGVKLSGFIVRELVNDVIQELDTENLIDNYEIFKFDEVNLYGVIAQDYLRVIERVLLNGVRVWCKGEIGELV